MSRFIKIFLLVLVEVCFSIIYCFAFSPQDLKGKTIILPSLLDCTEYISSFYDISVLEKGKFEDKFLITDTQFLNDTVFVKDVLHLNPDKPKKESIDIILSYNNRDFVFHFPFRYSSDIFRYHRYHLSRESRLNHNTYTISPEDIEIMFYDYDEYSKLRETFSSQKLYATEKTNGFDRFEPYKFVSLNFSSDTSHKLSKTLMSFLLATFESSDGKIIEMPIKVGRSYHYFQNGRNSGRVLINDGVNFDLQECISFFAYENDLISKAAKNANHILIDSIKNKFNGQEVYVAVYDAKQVSNFEIPLLNGNSFKWSYSPEWEKVTASEVKPLIVSDYYKGIIKANYYLILERDDKPFCGLLVDDKIFRYIEIATEREKRLEAERIESERRAAERHREIEQEEKNYIASLVRKYGKANADLILNEEIRLGFTYKMVEEAWGSPNDITTVTNYGGTIECWIYGFGIYVYFKGGKVVQIVN